MKTKADATISVDQLTAKFKTWQLYTIFTRNYSKTYARARIVYDLSHRVDGPLGYIISVLESLIITNDTSSYINQLIHSSLITNFRHSKKPCIKISFFVQYSVKRMKKTCINVMQVLCNMNNLN